MAIGIMVPIRLGTVSILKMIVGMGLINTLTALILVYTAMGLPLAILILGEFMAQIPRDLREGGALRRGSANTASSLPSSCR